MLLLTCLGGLLEAIVLPGVDVLFQEQALQLKGKKIGLLTTQIMLDSEALPSYQRFKKEASRQSFELKALFAPEHGFWAGFHADERVQDELDETGLVIYTLYGENRHPTKKQLEGIDLVVIDLQDVGVRSYTYASTAFYMMESCAEASIPVLILDRPNPINGLVVDGPCLEKQVRSFVGYIDVAFCHGMTLGEMAQYFNVEYKVGCKLKVIPMKGWKRSMSYLDTGLPWLGASPQIPAGDTPLYYAMTNLLGDLNWFNSGVWYTQPFRLLAHPDADPLAMIDLLKKADLPGVHFYPAYYKPFSGSHKLKMCKGVRLLVTHPLKYRPFQTQMALLDTLKKLYPKAFQAKLKALTKMQIDMMDKLYGIQGVKKILEEASPIGKAIEKRQSQQMQAFRMKRQLYLQPEYL